jgi:hypothetical protein
MLSVFLSGQLDPALNFEGIFAGLFLGRSYNV